MTSLTGADEELSVKVVSLMTTLSTESNHPWRPDMIVYYYPGETGCAGWAGLSLTVPVWAPL